MLGAFPELEGDEESSGIFTFAYDAVAAMYYAYSYLVSGDLVNVTYCSNQGGRVGAIIRGARS